MTDRGISVIVSVPDGEKLAQKTFNPRLGIVGGISILGTTGRVRPFSCKAIRETIRCVIDVAAAGKVDLPVLVPGHIGMRAARRLFPNIGEERIIEVSNEWGFAIDEIKKHAFRAILILGHPGKLAKVAQGEWDTHSSRSKSALPYVVRTARETTGVLCDGVPTVEGVFAALSGGDKRRLGDHIAGAVREAIGMRLSGLAPVAVVLVDLQQNLLGQEGDTTPWQ